MGNVDTRCHFDAGFMVVQTQHPYYCPGMAVSGTIYIRVTRPVNAKDVIIEIKGTEKAKFVEVVTRTDDDGHLKSDHEKRKSKREIVHYKQPAFVFAMPTLMPGDYTIPFTF